jgi:NAD(P)-dependent dehydrogenase (short-subunit alcohol dehydrogenase family)
MDLKIKNKLALVTGSTAGIGLAIAKALSLEGARTIINGRSKASVESAISGLKATANGPLFGFAGDLSTAEAANELMSQYPDVEILVNNLGIYEPVSFEEILDKEGKTFEEFEKDFFATIRPTSLIKRFASTEEVASLVSYIASPLASATTGAALRVDGGVVKSAF